MKSALHLDLAFGRDSPSSLNPLLPLFFAGGGVGDGLSWFYFIKLQYTAINYSSCHTLLLTNSYKHLGSKVILSSLGLFSIDTINRPLWKNKNLKPRLSQVWVG